MHQALQIPELFDIILDFATTVDDPSAGRATALRLALTNKYFLEQSLDRVWRLVPKILHVIKLFPQDLWTVRQTEFKPAESYYGQLIPQCTLHLTRNIAPSDWERFDYYAQRIHTLQLTSSATRYPDKTSPFPGVHPSIMKLLESRPRCCFPKLEHLALFQSQYPYFELEDVSWLITPGLHRLTLETDSNQFGSETNEQLDIFAAKLATFFTHCSQLQILELILDIELAMTIFDRLPTMPCLKEFNFFQPSSGPAEGSIDATAWLSVQPSLKTLRLGLNKTYDLHVDFERSARTRWISGPIFPALEEIEVVATGLPDLPGFITRLGRPKLRTLRAEVHRRIVDVEFTQLLEILPERLDIAYLTCLKIHLKDPGWVDVLEQGAVTLPTLRILFEARNLIHLDLRLNLSFGEITSFFLEEMAFAWPDIETLSLIGSQIEYNIGLLDVTNFARACPKLINLGLQFDADDIVRYQATEALDDRPIHVKELCVGTSNISNPDLVTAWLLQEFRELTMLIPYLGPCNENMTDEAITAHARWGHVLSRLFGDKSVEP